MRLFLLCLFLGAVSAEAPFAGYPASGWRPQGTQFRLPTEYGAPLVEQKVEVEISKENIAHAAQVVEAATEESSSNEYLPPTTTDQPELDPIRVQGLPDDQFRDFQRSNLQQKQRSNQQQPRSGQLRAVPNKNFQFGRQEQGPPAQTYGVPDEDEHNSHNQPENQYQGFQQSSRTNPATEQQQQQTFFLQNGQLRSLPAARNFQFSRQEQARPAQTYGVPDQDDNKSDDQDLPENQYQGFQQPSKFNQSPQQLLSGQLRAIPAKNVQFGRQEQAQPTQSYGVPDEDETDSGNQDLPEEPNPTNVPDSNNDDEDNQKEQDPTSGRPVIAIANSFSGQYYVLGQDNTLQRIMYATSQSDDDRRNMGFSAQLRYSQVEPIRGPVYAYNEQGQLVRIYK